MEDEFFTVKEFAEMLKVHTDTIRKEIKRGRLRAIRIGIGKNSVLRIYKYELDRYIAEEYQKYEEI
jgi:excisionase family DNA binding protein